MEEVCKIFPLLGEKIAKELDYQSLTKFKMASRDTYEFLDNGRILWKQMILKNIKGNKNVFAGTQKSITRLYE